MLVEFTLLSLLQVFHVSLSKNTELPTNLDVFLSLFLSLSVELVTV